MIWLICSVIGHAWSRWRYIRAFGRYDDRLDRTCKRCGKIETYTGLTDYNWKGEKVPINKN